MAIYFKFKNKNEIADKLHESLVGSPAYIDSEIALVKDTNTTTLCVGENNNNDTYIYIDSAFVTDNKDFQKHIKGGFYD